jgi:hypothetical protein
VEDDLGIKGRETPERERVINPFPSVNHFRVTWHNSVMLVMKAAHSFEMLLINYSPVRYAHCRSLENCMDNHVMSSVPYGYAVENWLWLMKNVSTVKWHWCAFRKKVTLAIIWIACMIKQCGHCIAQQFFFFFSFQLLSFVGSLCNTQFLSLYRGLLYETWKMFYLLNWS